MAYFERNGFRSASLDQSAISIERELGQIDFTVKDGKKCLEEATDELQSLKLDLVYGKHQQNDTVDDTVFYAKEDSVKGEWIESLFLKRIEDHISAEPRDLSWFLDKIKPVSVNVLKSLSFLIKELIRISTAHAIDYRTFSAIAILFSRLVESKSFSSLPRHFPYRDFTLELNDKLQHILTANSQSRLVRLKFSAARRAILIASRYEICLKVGDSDFSSVQKFLCNR